MGLFVALIPFLIIASSFVRFGGVDVQGPSAASGPSGKTEVNSRELWLIFEIQPDKVQVQAYRKDYAEEVAGLKAEFSYDDLSKMTAYLNSLAAKSYVFGPSLFHASPETKYEKAIEVLNAMKSSEPVKEIVMAAGVVE